MATGTLVRRSRAQTMLDVLPYAVPALTAMATATSTVTHFVSWPLHLLLIRQSPPSETGALFTHAVSNSEVLHLPHSQKVVMFNWMRMSPMWNTDQGAVFRGVPA